MNGQDKSIRRVRASLSALGILITEVMVYSTPVRVPALLILQQSLNFTGILRLLILTLISIIYLFIVGISREALLVVGLLVGAFVLSFAKIVSASFSAVSTKVLLLLVFVGILQVVTEFRFGNLFTNYAFMFPGKASGFSAEPSFFAWVFVYFWLMRFVDRGIDTFSIASFLAASFLMKAWTLLGFFTGFWAVFFLVKLIRKKAISLVILIVVFHALPLTLLLFNLPVFDLIYTTTGTWREPSHFAALLISEPFGPFSGGEHWEFALKKGLKELFIGNAPLWIVWPWSFSGTMALEFGFVTSILICSLIVWGNSVGRSNSFRHRVGWVLTNFIALFLCPKWMVFFFFFPFIRASTPKLRKGD